MVLPSSIRLLARWLAGAFVAIVLGIVPPVEAQEMRVGVRAGPTFGFLNDRALPFVSEPGVTEAGTNIRLDLHAGGYAVVPLGGRFSLQPELLLVRKGTHLSRSGSGIYIAEQYQLSYVEGRLLARRALHLPGALSAYAVAGLSGGWLAAASVRRDIRSDVQLREDIDLLRDDLVRRWDLGAVLGVALGYPIGRSSRVSLELRYAPGLRSVFTDAERPPAKRLDRVPDPPPLSASPPPLRHDVITASLSYSVTLHQ